MMRVSRIHTENYFPVFIGLLLALGVAILVLAAPRAYGAGITFSASTTVSLTNPAESWTIAGGSNASSVQVGTGSAIIAMQNTDAITLSVASRNFSITGQSSDTVITRNTLCYSNTGNQQAILTLTATQNETITVTTGTCGDYASGGSRRDPQILPTYGGERLISRPSPTPTPTPSPTPTPTPTPEFSTLPAKPTIEQVQFAISEVLQKITILQANPTVPDILGQLQKLVVRIALIQQAVTSGVARAVSDGAITQPLGQGSGGGQVTTLQEFLKSLGADIYPEGRVTGYFGPLTRAAVERFQEQYGIAGEGDPGYGYVGPRTRAKINSLLGQ